MRNKATNIAYRCPDCGQFVWGLVGKYALAADMLRLKCPCTKSHMDLHVNREGKIRLSIPCILCKKNHEYTVSAPIFYEKDLFTVGCPYSAVDIGFIGEEDKIKAELEKNTDTLNTIAKGFEAETIHDLQPEDMTEDDILTDPEIYDIFRFLVSDLKDEGKIHCPCKEGDYDLRYLDGGIQIVCKHCGATKDFEVESVSAAQEYLDLDEIVLT